MTENLFSLPLVYEQYKQWVKSHPHQASDMETTIKWISYFVAGRMRNSYTLSELVYCLSNLLVLHNDRIIIKLQRHDVQATDEVLKLWLTALEYSEVFLEISAESIYGVVGKWMIVTIVQLFKCICRLLLVYYYKNSITETPPIGPLSRNEFLRSTNIKCNGGDFTHMDAFTSNLSRSGRILRRVEASPDPHFRTWQALKKKENLENGLKQRLVGLKLAAETVYICKPLLHLGCVAFFSQKNWKPWMISFALDFFSLILYEQGRKEEKQKNKLNPRERMVISRRYACLLLYLLRTPFYEGYSKHTIETTLQRFGRKMPIVSFITKPILKYLPFWQSIYFYMWSN